MNTEGKFYFYKKTEGHGYEIKLREYIVWIILISQRLKK